MAHSTAEIAGQRNAANQKQQQQLPLFTLLQVCIALLVASSCLALPTAVQAKHLDGAHHYHAHHELQQQQQEHHAHHKRRLQRDSTSKILNTREQCNSVRDYFETIDIKLSGNFEEKGALCGGHCCTNSTELELRKKSTGEFERLLHHHTNSLRGILESTANLFQKHVLDLAEQSENKTLAVFSQVYRRMVPQSSELIHKLYSEIMNHLKNANSNSNLEDAIHKFFVNLFPVAYHQAVHLSKDNYGELHEDYINCLKHTFDDLQPFGSIPKEIKRNLLQSVQTATIFLNSLQQSAEVLSETDQLYSLYLTDNCQKHLLKMSYCPSCNGLQKTQVKPCYSYCMNVFHGCSAQYAGVLDSPWSNVVDAIQNLVTTHIRSDSGIVTTIKQLDIKLSETIMRAMENGPDLEMKVKKTCGTPKLLPSLTKDAETRPQPPHNIKWATPPDAEILHFQSTIDKSKEFYSNIVNNVCEDEDIQRNDHNCWTGDRVGDYTQLVMAQGVDTQRYNPEVPLEVNSQSTKLNELVDKLIKVRKNIGAAVPSTTRSYSDIQSDMARHDEEGSGHMPDDMDDEEYGNQNGSGDGSGDGATSSPFDPLGPTEITNNDIQPRQENAATCHSSFGTLLATAALLVPIASFLLSSS
ncbi:division abnormally delayed protein isoform X1 [Zeugodacus cucurbitae]|uniref:division abnormally delayed protein isoform X1 n=1 Tax=Zeugodacus cucurbitae TaxID=28588 RepID=UPI0023D93110|nr:division abnormally delayed protein isoform X1 [Zeugodacus cucurbitae]